MPTISKKPLTRVCVIVYKEDYETMRQITQISNEICLNHLIRTVFRTYVTQLKAREGVLSLQDAFTESLRTMGIPRPVRGFDLL